MKFVQNNKILVDSNAESAEISAEKTRTGYEGHSEIGIHVLKICVARFVLFSALISALSAPLRKLLVRY